MIKKIFLLTILLPLFSFAQLERGLSFAHKLHLPKPIYKVGEEIILSYTDFSEDKTAKIVLYKGNGEELKVSDYLVGNGTWSNAINETGNYYFAIVKKDLAEELSEIYSFAVVDEASTEASVMFQRDVDSDDALTGYRASVSKDKPESIFADSFQVSESFELSSITFYGFQVKGFSYSSGLEVYIYKDKDGFPAGKPKTDDSGLIMQLTLRENSMYVHHHMTLIKSDSKDPLMFLDYNIDVKRILESEGKSALMLEKNEKYWVAFVPVFSGDSLAKWVWRSSTVVESDHYAKEFDFELNDWISHFGVNFAFTVRGVKSEKLEAEEFVLNPAEKINVTPNPSDGLFSVLPDQNIRALKVCDVSGRVIARSETNQVDITSNEKGIYLLLIEDDQGVQTTKKIIKN